MNQPIINKAIQPGDRVTVNFGFQYVNDIVDAEVLRRPADTGDTWSLKTLGGQLVEIMHFARMDRLSPLKNISCRKCEVDFHYREGLPANVICPACGESQPKPREEPGEPDS